MGEDYNMKEGDLVLNPNEYAFVRDDTKGVISCACGPYKMSLSNSDKVVVWDEKSKRFVGVNSRFEGIKTFVTAPENFYVELKNPAVDNSHPREKTVETPTPLNIGKKVNIKGNCSFALYPGQMAKVIAGHSLRSNQYLLVKVYDSDVLNAEPKEIKMDQSTNNENNPEEKKTENKNVTQETSQNEKKKYVTGELLVIKGTEVPFYIPPTGMEVIPDEDGNYIRNAVSLEKLEYCILVNEKGDKKYVHGPDVVFPSPDETFVRDENGSAKYMAIELSPTSGLYVKVIGDYSENGVQHKIGEELFITGKECMIYYPRAEHAIIDYDGQIIYHATEIPAGEGRYVLDRIKGTIRTVKGPVMYLPNPINEVFVQRKLTENQCRMWYPGNDDVLFFNTGKSDHRRNYDDDDCYTPDIMNSNLRRKGESFHKGFSRGTTYYDPRTLTFDNKFKGVVTVDIWTGYAVNVVSKNGARKVVTGPCTYLLEYDESLEVMELSTGKPKTTDELLKTVYLRVNNNKISDIIKVETKDGISVSIKVSYCVDFLEDYKDNWFLVENYVKFLCDNMRSIMKRVAKKYGIQEFYQNASKIVRNTILGIEILEEVEQLCTCRDCTCDHSEHAEDGKKDDIVSLDALSVLTNKTEETKEETVKDAGSLEIIPERCEGDVVFDDDEGRLFEENGMFIKDVDVLSIHIEDDDMEYEIKEQQRSTITSSFELENKMIELELATKKSKIEDDLRKLHESNNLSDMESKHRVDKRNYEIKKEIETLKAAVDLIALTAKEQEQSHRDNIASHELERERQRSEQNLDLINTREQIKSDALEAYANNISSVIESVTPDLIEALRSNANAELMKSLTENMSPYAIARDKSILDVTVGLTKGTGIDSFMTEIIKFLIYALHFY